MQVPSLQRVRLEKSVSSSSGGAAAGASKETPHRWQKELSSRTSDLQEGQILSPKACPQ